MGDGPLQLDLQFVASLGDLERLVLSIVHLLRISGSIDDYFLAGGQPTSLRCLHDVDTPREACSLRSCCLSTITCVQAALKVPGKCSTTGCSVCACSENGFSEAVHAWVGALLQ